MSKFLDLAKERRSVYALSNEKIVPEEQVRQIIEQALLNTPSSFNSQTARLVLLFDEQSTRFWDLVGQQLKPLMPEENFEETQTKLAGFSAGYGTVLFFEEQDTIEKLQSQFALYADNFPVWSLQSSGMLQFAIWAAFANEGLGASLQHYNPVIDKAVAKEWGLPESWKLWAQMPFGKKMEIPPEKPKLPLEERLKVFGEK